MYKTIRSITVVAIVAGIGFGSATSAADQQSPPRIDAATLDTIAVHLATDGVKAIDFTAKSGAYCVNAGLPKGGHMTHYARDPKSTKEDIVDFVHAGPFVEAGLDITKLPRHPGTLGSMVPGTWYHLPAGELEPHHGARLPFPVLIRATDTD